jgi:hypothetical protein
MHRKRCYKCQKQRLLKFFSKRSASSDGLQKICKDCANVNNHKYYQNNKSYYNNRYISNRDILLNRNKQWNNNNPEKVKEHKYKFIKNNPDYYSKYREQNKETLNSKTRVRNNLRLKNDPIFKLKKNYRNRLYDYYKGSNRSKTSEKIIGINWIGFKLHIEQQFSDGMTWDNYGAWHIDHITPLSAGKTKKELETLFHYTNCQPLWATENLSKSDKLILPNA